MKSMAQRVQGLEDSIFGKMSKMAVDFNAINLAQGFPDFEFPKFIPELVLEAFQRGFNQYAPFAGLPLLREEIAKMHAKTCGVHFNPEKEITVSVGATQGIFLTIASLVEEGDEVLLFSPFYDSYKACVEMSGGKPVEVILKSENEFELTQSDLEKSFSDKTKLVIFNNPHNPSGKVFNEKQLELLAKFCEKYDSYLLSDEVYEHLVFDEAKFVSFSSFPRLKERVIILGSMGKTFGLTGLKIGWIFASALLTQKIRQVHQYNVFCAPTPLQWACAEALKRLDEFLPEFKKIYLEKRDFLYRSLQEANLNPILPKGTYFMVCDVSNHLTSKNMDPMTFAKMLTKDFSVSPVPLQSFYLDPEHTESKKLMRFCFAKKIEALEKAAQKLKNFSL